MADVDTSGLVVPFLVEVGRTEAEVISQLLGDPGDVDPPSVTLDTVEGPIAPGDPITFTVADPSGLTVSIAFVYADRTESALIDADPSAQPFYLDPYEVQVTPNMDGSYTLEVTHTDGWPDDFFAVASVIDFAGNSSGASGTFTRDPEAEGVSVSVDTAPGEIAPDTALQVTFGQGTGQGASSTIVVATFAEVAELVWDGSPGPGYDVDETDGVLTITRTAGWPRDLTIVATITEKGGGSSSASASYDVEPEEEIPTPDETPPEVGNLSPAPGTPITTTTPLAFDVTDDSGAFRRVLLAVAFTTGSLAGVTELVHDGDAFVGHYSVGCSRTPIAGGFRYTILRAGGWPASPTLRVFAFDRSGNEV